MLEALIIGFIGVAFGTLILAKPDLMWRWQKNANDMRGVESKYNKKFEEGRQFTGCLTLLFGIGFILIAISTILPTY